MPTDAHRFYLEIITLIFLMQDHKILALVEDMTQWNRKHAVEAQEHIYIYFANT